MVSKGSIISLETLSPKADVRELNLFVDPKSEMMFHKDLKTRFPFAI